MAIDGAFRERQARLRYEALYAPPLYPDNEQPDPTSQPIASGQSPMPPLLSAAAPAASSATPTTPTPAAATPLKPVADPRLPSSAASQVKSSPSTAAGSVAAGGSVAATKPASAMAAAPMKTPPKIQQRPAAAKAAAAPPPPSKPPQPAPPAQQVKSPVAAVGGSVPPTTTPRHATVGKSAVTECPTCEQQVRVADLADHIAAEHPDDNEEHALWLAANVQRLNRPEGECCCVASVCRVRGCPCVAPTLSPFTVQVPLLPRSRPCR